MQKRNERTARLLLSRAVTLSLIGMCAFPIFSSSAASAQSTNTAPRIKRTLPNTSVPVQPLPSRPDAKPAEPNQPSASTPNISNRPVATRPDMAKNAFTLDKNSAHFTCNVDVQTYYLNGPLPVEKKRFTFDRLADGKFTVSYGSPLDSNALYQMKIDGPWMSFENVGWKKGQSPQENPSAHFNAGAGKTNWIVWPRLNMATGAFEARNVHTGATGSTKHDYSGRCTDGD